MTRNLMLGEIAVFAIILAAVDGAYDARGDELRVGIGAGVAPDFPGSGDYSPVPLPSLFYETSRFTIRTRGFGIEADVIPSRRIDFGPIIRFDTGRDDFNDVDDPVIEALGQVDAGVELGAFVSTGFPIIRPAEGDPTLITGRLSAVQSVGGHDGALIEGSVGIVRPQGRFTLVASTFSTFATNDYTDAYFGVTPAGALASGLETFDPGAGFRDVGVSAVATYDITDRWAASAVGRYARLVGDVSDSPIVDRGSADQLFFGISFSYRLR